MAANSKKETHIFEKKNDPDDLQQSEDSDCQNPSPGDLQSGPLAVEREESTEYRLLPSEETPFVAEVVSGSTNQQNNIPWTPSDATGLHTVIFQNPFQFGSESAAHVNYPKSMTEKFLLPATAVDIAVEFQQMAAIGGAVGALVLGSWSMIGAVLTPWSAINALLAIVLGIYGLRSNRKRMALLGIVLAVAGLVLSLFEVNVVLSTWFNSESSL